MNSEKDWMAKATENITAAQLCFEKRLFNASVNRAYYAMFQGAIAALIKHRVQPSGGLWKHDFVHAQFSAALIHRRKIFHGKLADTLLTVMRQRHVADYSITIISEKVANRMLRNARDFVGQIREVMER